MVPVKRYPMTMSAFHPRWPPLLKSFYVLVFKLHFWVVECMYRVFSMKTYEIDEIGTYNTINNNCDLHCDPCSKTLWKCCLVIFSSAFIWQDLVYNGEICSVEVHFMKPCKDMYGIVNDSASIMTCIAKIRRLSTPSFGDKPLSVDSYVTQWRWYWKDDDGAWLIYGSVSISKSFFFNYI